MSSEIIQDLANPNSANCYLGITFYLINACFSCLSISNKALPKSVWGNIYYFVLVLMFFSFMYIHHVYAVPIETKYGCVIP